ncbi:MAG: hypothetical protein P0119_07510 [Nitrospira sp.]|nr:hypothetical protein [Nitrospira sp.]
MIGIGWLEGSSIDEENTKNMWPCTVERHFGEHLALLVLLIVGVSVQLGCESPETILLIEKPTEVHSIDQAPASSESSGASVQPGKVIAVLKVGEKTKAIGVYHGQDYDGFKVKLADGTEGLIIAGDTFKIVTH